MVKPLPNADIQLVIFDLMGTLICDEGVVDSAYHAALVQAGVLPDTPSFTSAWQQIIDLRGRPTLVVLTEVLGDPIAAEEATWVFDDSILSSVSAMEPIAGAPGVLQRLSEQGILTAVTTSFTPEVRKAVLKKCSWEDTFAEMLSARGNKRGHPAPDLLLEAILNLGIDSVAQVAIVGDSAADLEAGNRAGAGLVVGVRTGDAPAGTLEAAPHTHLIDSVAELEAVLDAPRTKGARRTSDR